MKKLKSTWYNMAGTLTLISVVAGASLASVNEMTKGPIELIKQQTLEILFRKEVSSFIAQTKAMLFKLLMRMLLAVT